MCRFDRVIKRYGDSYSTIVNTSRCIYCDKIYQSGRWLFWETWGTPHNLFNRNSIWVLMCSECVSNSYKNPEINQVIDAFVAEWLDAHPEEYPTDEGYFCNNEEFKYLDQYRYFYWLREQVPTQRPYLPVVANPKMIILEWDNSSVSDYHRERSFL